MPAAATSNNLVSNLMAAAKSDPKKAGVLAVLVAVLGVMWARMAMNGGGGGPQAAEAAPAAATDNQVAARVRPAIRAAGGGAAMAQWRSTPVSPVVRNLFAVQLDEYAQQGGRPAAPAARVDDGFWDELAKSLSTQADQRKQKQIRAENLRTEAEQLRPQTIVMGASPKAVIRGEMVGEGSVVAGFRVLKIEARRIIVEREGIKLEIPMKQ